MATTKKEFKQILSEDKLYLADDLYTKDEVDNKIGSAIHYKGSVAAYTDLPHTGQQVGDMWNVKATGKNYVWAENPEMKDPPEAGWDDISTTVDLSNYYTKKQTDSGFATKGELETTNTAVAGKQDKINLNSGILKATSTGIAAAVADTDYATPSLVTNGVNTAKAYADGLGVGFNIYAGTDAETRTKIEINMPVSATGWPSVFFDAGTGLSISGNYTTGVVKYSALAASTSQAGVVKLSDSITGSSHTNAATEYAVSAALASAKAYVDSFDTGVTSVNGKTGAVTLSASDVSALALSGGTVKGNVTVSADKGYFKVVDTDSTAGLTAQYEASRIVFGTPLGNQILSFPVASGTLALQATTLSGYGITDAKIENGTITLGNQTITPLVASDISDMATKTWVGQQGYLTSSAISDMATKTWVGQQGYLTTDDISGKVDKSTLKTYLTTGAGGVLEAFPTSGYNIQQLVTHYNTLLKAFRNIVSAIS